MLRQSLKAFVCAAALMSAVPVLAADNPPPPPAPDMAALDAPGSHSLASCIYVRGDAGGFFAENPSLSAGSGERVEDTATFGVGVGCQLTPHLRVDLTAGAGLRQSIHDSGRAVDATLQSYTGFANVYYDITNYAGFTPYLGGGVGFAFHDMFNINQPLAASPGEEFDFAWNIQAGLSYDFSRNAKLDFGYRLVDLGTAKSDGPTPLYIRDIKAHEFRVGLRYQFGGW